MRRRTRLAAAAWAVAAVLWACGGAPARDTPEWTEQIRNREILISTQSVPGTPLLLTSATGMTDLSPPAAWEVFRDVENFDTYLWRVDSSTELPPQGDNRVFRFVVDAPFIAYFVGLDRIDITFVLSESISEDGKVRRGDFQSIEGNVRNAYGSWVVEQMDDGRHSLAGFSLFLDLGIAAVPDSLTNYFVNDFVDRWAHDLRKYAEKNRGKFEYIAAERAGRNPNRPGPTMENVGGDFVR